MQNFIFTWIFKVLVIMLNFIIKEAECGLGSDDESDFSDDESMKNFINDSPTTSDYSDEDYINPYLNNNNEINRVLRTKNKIYKRLRRIIESFSSCEDDSDINSLESDNSENDSENDNDSNINSKSDSSKSK